MKTEKNDHTIEMIFSCPSLENIVKFNKFIEPILKNAYGNENVWDFEKIYWSKSRHARVMCVFINLNGKSNPTQERKGKCQ